MMRVKMKILAIGTALGGLVLAVPIAAPLLTRPALAQSSDMMGGGSSQLVTARAKVTAINAAKRDVTLVGAAGNTVVVRAGEDVRNFDKIKVGDTVVAKYYSSLLLVLSPAGVTTPDDMVAAAADRAAKGQVPAGAVATRTIVTGTVVGVDPGAHTISLVDPSGGLVRTFDVTDPQRQARLKDVKVGDSLTAISTEAFAVALDPA